AAADRAGEKLRRAFRPANTSVRQQLIRRFTALAPQMSGDQAEQVAREILTTPGIGLVPDGVARWVRPETADRAVGELLAGVGSSTTPTKWSELAQGFRRLAPQMRDVAARKAADQLNVNILSAIDKNTDVSALPVLVRALATIAPWLSAEQADRAAMVLLAAFDNPAKRSGLWEFSPAMAAIAPRVQPEAAHRAAAAILTSA